MMPRRYSGSSRGGFSIPSIIFTALVLIAGGAFLWAVIQKNHISLDDPGSIIGFSKKKGHDLEECYKQNTTDHIQVACFDKDKGETNQAAQNTNAGDYTTRVTNLPVVEKQDTGYKRTDWRHWSSQGTCDTRVTVLMTQGQNVGATGCKITSGTWVSPYDNKTVTSSSMIDIDHVIPLKYAATHGGAGWDAATKERFANDTTQLLAVSRESNRSKSDKGPAEYMPDDSYKCEYSKKWVDTVEKYPGLGVTSADKEALQAGLAKC